MDLKQYWALAQQAVNAWTDDYAPSMGAALSYYTLFSIAPLLLIVIAVAGMAFGDQAARGEIFAQLNALIGPEGAAAIEKLLQHADQNDGQGLVAAVTGVLVLLLGATTVFGELQNALDRIWRAPQVKQSGLWKLLRSRFLSFGMILGIAFLLMVSLVLSAVLSALGRLWGAAFGGWEVLAHLLDIALSFGLTTLLFAMIYKFIPRARIGWRDVWIGAAVTAFLFAVGKFLIGVYIGKSGVASVFGAAGSLVVLMVWVYYSAQIFLLGAEFTRLYAYAHGSRAPEVQALVPSSPPYLAVSSDSRIHPALAFAVAAALGVAARAALDFLRQRRI
jgi:membrane protein